MSSTNNISVAPSESAEVKRARRLQRRRERERELVVHLKQRNNGKSHNLSRRIRDRVRRKAQSAEQRQTLPIPFRTRSGSPQTMFCMSLVIGASLSEPHIDELNVRNPYIIIYVWYVRHPRAAIEIVQEYEIYSNTT